MSWTNIATLTLSWLKLKKKLLKNYFKKLLGFCFGKAGKVLGYGKAW